MQDGNTPWLSIPRRSHTKKVLNPEPPHIPLCAQSRLPCLRLPVGEHVSILRMCMRGNPRGCLCKCVTRTWELCVVLARACVNLQVSNMGGARVFVRVWSEGMCSCAGCVHVCIWMWGTHRCVLCVLCCIHVYMHVYMHTVYISKGVAYVCLCVCLFALSTRPRDTPVGSLFGVWSPTDLGSPAVPFASLPAGHSPEHSIHPSPPTVHEGTDGTHLPYSCEHRRHSGAWGTVSSPRTSHP